MDFARSNGWLRTVEWDEDVFPSYSSESGTVRKAFYVKNLAVLSIKAERSIEIRKMHTAVYSQKWRKRECSWSSCLLLELEVFDELSNSEVTIYGISDFCDEQFDVEIGAFQYSHDIFSWSFGSCDSKNNEKDCEESKQQFGLISVPCKAGREKRECCGELRL